MKRRVFLVAASLAGLPMQALADPKKLRAAAVLDRVDDMYRGKSSHSRMVMTITAQTQRKLEVEVWSKGHDKLLVKILSPAKERGTSTLKLGSDVWNYFPKIDRLIKIAPSMMGGAWMGSHISNSELVTYRRLNDNYEISDQHETNTGNAKGLELLLVPKSNARVVWSKVEARAEGEGDLPAELRYHAEERLSHSVTFSEWKRFGGQLAPALMTVQPADKPGEMTQLRYDEIEFGVELSDGLFSHMSLRRGGM